MALVLLSGSSSPCDNPSSQGSAGSWHIDSQGRSGRWQQRRQGSGQHDGGLFSFPCSLLPPKPPFSFLLPAFVFLYSSVLPPPLPSPRLLACSRDSDGLGACRWLLPTSSPGSAGSVIDLRRSIPAPRPTRHMEPNPKHKKVKQRCCRRADTPSKPPLPRGSSPFSPRLSASADLFCAAVAKIHDGNVGSSDNGNGNRSGSGMSGDRLDDVGPRTNGVPPVLCMEVADC